MDYAQLTHGNSESREYNTRIIGINPYQSASECSDTLYSGGNELSRNELMYGICNE